ncbi:hypothetical protein AB1Y20_013556 [Prymnesium parvum]|uniref:Protein Mpv17 n=1 Tax=Prymnesium parvum TaxID=97485 RepID=A0AB34II56_PRYPA
MLSLRLCSHLPAARPMAPVPFSPSFRVWMSTRTSFSSSRSKTSHRSGGPRRPVDKFFRISSHASLGARMALEQARLNAAEHAAALRTNLEQAATTAAKQAELAAKKGHLTARIAISQGKQRSSFFEWYCSKLESHPLATKSITTAGVGAMGDILAQATLSSGPYSPRRTASMATTGLFLSGPSMHAWYGLLNSRFGGRTVGRIAQRIALDQGLFTPFFTPVSLVVIMGLQGQSDVFTRVGNILWPTVSASWMCWVPAQTINFAVVPASFQVLFVNAISLFWSMYVASATSG